VGFKAVGAGILKVQGTRSQWTAQREKRTTGKAITKKKSAKEQKMVLRDERDGNTRGEKGFG
jgi:hypothetical protein